MNKLSKSIISLILSLLTLSCSKEELPGNGEEVNGEALTINVVDKGYASQDSVSGTKATTDGSYVTTFVEGDEIGVYVVANNEIVQSNVKLTKSSSGWTAGEEITSKKDNEMKFFAYYPYDVSISSEKLTASASDAEGFFATYLSEIVLPTDQSDAGKYSKADIMVGDGVLAGTALTFGMKHQMGLVVICFPEEVTANTVNYDLDGTEWTATNEVIPSLITEVQMKGNNMYSISDNKYVYLIKPDESFDISGTFKTNSISKNFTKEGVIITKSRYKTYNISIANLSQAVDVEYEVKIGDYYMNDGTLVHYREDLVLNEEQKGKCIGLVFQTDIKRIGNGEKAALLENKGVSSPHGLVMALTDASTSAQWKTSNDGNHVTAECTTRDNCKADISGLKNYNEVKNADSDFSAFPAFAAAETYNTTVNVSSLKTTGWFLPSIGQWWDILANLGNSDFSNSNGSTTGNIDWSGQSSKAVGDINIHLNKIGGSYVNQFSTSMGFWTSSEYNSGFARYVYFYSDGNLYLVYNNKNGSCRVRCVLAF